jgi:hypothetical protein
MLNIQPKAVRDVAERFRHSPGFIAYRSRYLYVTPLLMARVAFQSAWERWIAPDARRFLAEFPADLIDAFMERVQASGTDAMREVVSDFFLEWVRNLGPLDLGHEPTVSRLVRIIEVNPGPLGPLLRDLIERTSLEELGRLHSGYKGEKSRRELVWLAEELAYFGEYFQDAEAVLLRLALAETEQHLGNSATRIWAALFRIVLSGTSVPFIERLGLLEGRLREADAAQLTLALEALDEILADGPVSRLAAPPVLFGRKPPEQWRPADVDERQACRSLALAMAARLASAGGAVAEGVRAAVIKSLSPLLLQGYIEQAQAVIGSAPLPDALLAAVAEQLAKFLDIFCKDHSSPVQRARGKVDRNQSHEPATEGATGTRQRVASAELEARVRHWYESLIPPDLHGRLVSIVGLDPWYQQLHGDNEAFGRGLRELAAEFLRSPASLSQEQGWLCSREAKSAFNLGQALGEVDRDGLLLDRMIGEFARARGTALVRGYLDSLVIQHPHHLDQANQHLDRLQSEHPHAAYEVLWSAGDELRKVPRLFQMVDTGGLPAGFLLGLVYGARRALQTDELIQALERLIRAAQSGDGRAAHAAVHVLYSHLHSPQQAAGVDLLRQEDRLLKLLPQVLELAFDAIGPEPNFWIHLLDDLAAVNSDRAIHLAMRALVGDGYERRVLVEERLARLAGSSPEALMRSLGDVILRPETGWRFHVHDFSRLLRSLPGETVQSWLDKAGVEGARGLARHLEAPYLDDEGRPIVPSLTAFVLDRFADDERLFREFCAGARSVHVYRGDFPAHLDRRAEVAHHFMRHPLKRVRDWARDEIEFARRESALWRQHQEEEEMAHPELSLIKGRP